MSEAPPRIQTSNGVVLGLQRGAVGSDGRAVVIVVVEDDRAVVVGVGGVSRDAVHRVEGVPRPTPVVPAADAGAPVEAAVVVPSLVDVAVAELLAVLQVIVPHTPRPVPRVVSPVAVVPPIPVAAVVAVT